MRLKSNLNESKKTLRNIGVTPSAAENDDDSRRFFSQTRLPTSSIFHSNQCNIMLHAAKPQRNGMLYKSKAAGDNFRLGRVAY